MVVARKPVENANSPTLIVQDGGDCLDMWVWMLADDKNHSSSMSSTSPSTSANVIVPLPVGSKEAREALSENCRPNGIMATLNLSPKCLVASCPSSFIDSELGLRARPSASAANA